MDSWYLRNLVCPRDHHGLSESDSRLVCPNGHDYPVVDGVPVMLLDEVDQTIGIARASLDHARRPLPQRDPTALYLDTLGLSDDEKNAIRTLALDGRSRIDPVVAYAVAATNGFMYQHLIGKLESYPIPELRLSPGQGRSLLDIGCNWGRWSIAAAKKGYSVVGIDPSLGSILAARRVSESLGVAAKFVVGDARFLPFAAVRFDAAFSYSVVQHLSRQDAALVVREIGRTLKPGGSSLVQFPTVFGLRCLYHQARRRFREPSGFDVRYWTIPTLKRLFAGAVGPASVSVDCYFGIGLQKSDAALMPGWRRLIIDGSEFLRRATRVAPFLTYVADSVYVASVKAS